MSPILVRPVREQLEHDRIIRVLQAKFRRRYEVGINPGSEQQAPVNGVASVNGGNIVQSGGVSSLYPDLVLLSLERSRRLQGVVEVETGESVNHLEALAQWANFARLKADFHLYVPSGMVEVARRLCEDNQIQVDEIWSYHTVGDEVRFTLVHRARESTRAAPTPSRPKLRPAKVRAPGVKAARSAKPARPGKSAKSVKPTRAAKSARPMPRARPSKKSARPKKRK